MDASDRLDYQNTDTVTFQTLKKNLRKRTNQSHSSRYAELKDTKDKNVFGNAQFINESMRPILLGSLGSAVTLGASYFIPKEYLIAGILIGAVSYGIFKCIKRTSDKKTKPQIERVINSSSNNNATNTPENKKSEKKLHPYTTSTIKACATGIDSAETALAPIAVPTAEEAVNKFAQFPTELANQTVVDPGVSATVSAGTMGLKLSITSTIEKIEEASAKLSKKTTPKKDLEETKRALQKKNIFEAPYVLGGSLKITPDEWAVSVVCNNRSKNPMHVFLTIHGMDQEGGSEAYRVHLLLDEQSTPSRTISSGSLKKAKIELENYTDLWLENPATVEKYYNQCVHSTTQITAEKGKELLQLIKSEQEDDLHYSLIDGDIKNVSVTISTLKETKNCKSWAVYVLEKCGIDLVKNNFFLPITLERLIVYHPNFLVSDHKNK